MPPPCSLNIALSARNQSSTAAQRNNQSNWTPPPLSKDNIKQVQRVIGSILYYPQAVGLTVLMALSTIASKQAKGTKSTMKKCKELHNYHTTHLDTTVQFYASNIILNKHYNALYLSKANAHSCACGHFIMG
jgi:hypothetical protein